jgi:hypothetical protein
MSIQTTTDIAAQTVERVATGQIPVPVVQPERKRRVRRSVGGTWNSPVAREQVPEELLTTARAAANGDSNRLWFGDDGAVWILNHRRGETCISKACPACAPR